MNLENHKKGIGYYLLGVFVVMIGIALFSLPYQQVIQQKVDAGLADGNKINNQAYVLTLMDLNWNLFYMLLPFVGGMIFLVLVVYKIHQQNWTSFTTKRKSIDLKRILFSFLVWGLINVGVILLEVFLNPGQMILQLHWKPFLILILLSMVFIPIQTSFEEYFFRGYLFQALHLNSVGKWLPWVATSVCFGLMHLANPEVAKLGYGIMAFYIGTGFFLGLLVVADDGLELSLGFHMANNLFTAILVTANWTAFHTHALFVDTSEPVLWKEILKALVLLPIFYWIVAKKYSFRNVFSKFVS